MPEGSDAATALRLRALAGLGVWAPEAAIEALRDGALWLGAASRRWASSGGDVAAHPVLLAVNAETLGALDRSPASVDALVAALAASLSASGELTLDALTLGWDGRARASLGAAPYRTSPASQEERDAASALRGYLGGGEASVEALERARCRLDAARALVSAWARTDPEV